VFFSNNSLNASYKLLFIFRYFKKKTDVQHKIKEQVQLDFQIKRKSNIRIKIFNYKVCKMWACIIVYKICNYNFEE
jgi:hypothetical protein